MSNVAELADKQPRITVNANDGVHVYPVALLRAIVRGDIDPEVLGTESLRAILSDFLSYVDDVLA